MSRKPQILKGFRDYTPKQMVLRNRMIEIFRSVFEKHGFEPIDTPTLEYMEILTGKAGENEKLMYHFADQGEREIGLRYDLTVPLARFVAMHQNDIVLPFKRYHIAPVWRAEKPQRGRFREFIQCDADIVGSPSMLADAEAINVMVDALAAINLSSAKILINHRGLLSAMATLAGVSAEQSPTIFRAVDKLGKIGPDGVRAELIRSGVTEVAANNVLDLVAVQGTSDQLLDFADDQLREIGAADQSTQELRQLLTYLADLGVNPDAYRIDLSLARGIDYYTGPVFEAVVEEPKVGSVAGAGRYDGLVGTFLGRDIPATGMSLGFERILEVVEEFNLLDTPPTVAQVFVATLPDTLSISSQIARDLRNDGLNVDQSILGNRGIGDQLKYADRKGIGYAVIVGSTEIASGVAQLKDLKTGDQREVPLANVANEVKIALEN